MPLYEYQCDDCGVRFERRQPITADALTECPECGGEVRRLFHPVGIVFKGKGFYVTDNRSKAKSSTAAPKTREEAKKKTTGKSEEKKETKSSSTSSSKSEK